MKLLNDRHLFWDTDVASINSEKHKQAIIERVIERGTWEQFKELVENYGRNEIIKAIKNARYFTDKTMHFVSGYFSIPLKDLKCYSYKQSSPTPYL